jgi:hypothetical protein
MYTVHLNTRPAAMATGWQPGDEMLGVWAIIADSLEEAYAVGNKQTTDSGDCPYPWYLRSLSVGDILLADTRFWAVEPSGWREVPYDEFVQASGRPWDHGLGVNPAEMKEVR